MLRFLQTFLDIALWRKGPQDLPASRLLVLLVFGAYLLTGLVRMRLFTLGLGESLLFICIDVLMLAGWLWLVLAFFGRRQRFEQTISATLGVGLLILLGDIAVRTLQITLGLSDTVAVNWLLLRFVITVLVLGRIFKLALDRGLVTGIALTVAITFSTKAVVQLMFTLRG